MKPTTLKSRNTDKVQNREQEASQMDQQLATPPVSRSSEQKRIWLCVSGCLMLGAILWSYWPTLQDMVHQWEIEPDYSHGFLVAPIALIFLWARRNKLSADDVHVAWAGAGLLALATALRFAAGKFYLTPLDGWTLPLTIAGAVWLLCGRRALVWSLPSIAFLWFMVPIPYSAERWLSVPLQSVATKTSAAALVFLGQPAISEGNTILLGNERLFVGEACSGMRIFVGVFALAFAFVLFSNWKLWLKAFVLLAALPVAIVTNAARIVATGLLYQWVSTKAGEKFTHDIAGFLMIPLAAGVFWLLLIYLDKLFPLVEDVGQGAELLRRKTITNA